MMEDLYWTKSNGLQRKHDTYCAIVPEQSVDFADDKSRGAGFRDRIKKDICAAREVGDIM